MVRSWVMVVVGLWFGCTMVALFIGRIMSRRDVFILVSEPLGRSTCLIELVNSTLLENSIASSDPVMPKTIEFGV